MVLSVTGIVGTILIIPGAIAFHFLQIQQFTALEWTTNIGFHFLLPLLVWIDFRISDSYSSLEPAVDKKKFFVYSYSTFFSYLIITMVYGTFTGIFPYPIVNYQEYVVLTIVGCTTLFLVGTWMLFYVEWLYMKKVPEGNAERKHLSILWRSRKKSKKKKDQTQEKTIQEKTYHIKQQTHKHANTKQRTDEQTQRSTDNTDIENMLERKSKWKKKE